MPFLKSLLLIISLHLFTISSLSAESLKIGSKLFTESVLLAEMPHQIAQHLEIPSEHIQELGGTNILWNALIRGEIDIYPEYTGTLMQVVLYEKNISTLDELKAELSKHGIRMTGVLGFNNTYILGMKKQRAQELQIQKISDLKQHPDLSFGFSEEFMARREGWLGLQKQYFLPQTDVVGMSHDLAYRGVEEGSLDLTDLYSTDPEIQYYDLLPLEDDLSHFPIYEALWLYRAELEQTHPELIQTLKQLEGSINEELMVQLNAQVKLHQQKEAHVVSGFLKQQLGFEVSVKTQSLFHKIWNYTLEHLLLVGVSLGAAILIGVPLGILAATKPWLGQVVLGSVGVIQTIPSLAILVFMIPLLGIGTEPAIMALFLYSLLPIVRNTYLGLHEIPNPIFEAAAALGLPPRTKLFLIELPMAYRSILAGIKTSAIINIGTATLGALIGAGGYGQPILTGIRLDNFFLILQGAVPAALLALLAQLFFDFLERYIVPKGLQLKKAH